MCQNIITRSPQSIQFNEDVAPTNDASVTDLAERDSRVEVLLSEVEGSDSEQFKSIVKLKLEGLSWRRIAKRIGMSHEGARKCYEKHIGAVREHLKT